MCVYYEIFLSINHICVGALIHFTVYIGAPTNMCRMINSAEVSYVIIK